MGVSISKPQHNIETIRNEPSEKGKNELPGQGEPEAQKEGAEVGRAGQAMDSEPRKGVTGQAVHGRRSPRNLERSEEARQRRLLGTEKSRMALRWTGTRPCDPGQAAQLGVPQSAHL